MYLNISRSYHFLPLIHKQRYALSLQDIFNILLPVMVDGNPKTAIKSSSDSSHLKQSKNVPDKTRIENSRGTLLKYL